MPCSSHLCKNDTTGRSLYRCLKCRDADPPVAYCDRKCQVDDWPMHKRYCGRKAYTFHVTLFGSHDPPITRTFDIPAHFTFTDLHLTIQYAFDWNCTHLHEFYFANRSQTNEEGLVGAHKPGIVMKLRVPHPDREWAQAVPEDQPLLSDKVVRLFDVFSGHGSRRQQIQRLDGTRYPLFYMYDLGDNWEHRVEFLGANIARSDRPQFLEVNGCAPLDDCGGIQGWEEVKAAFAAVYPTREQKEKMQWARTACRKWDEFRIDQTPDFERYNDESRWENCSDYYVEMERELSSYGNPYVSV